MRATKLRRLRDRSNGPATLISDGCKISGTISGDGDYLVSGQVEGDCDLDGSLTLAVQGRWTGTIRAGTVVVAGTVEGDVTSDGHVEISETARINGTVSAGSIAVAVGAVVEGEMKTNGGATPQEFVEKRDASVD